MSPSTRTNMITLSLRAAVRLTVALGVALSLGGCRIDDLFNIDVCGGSAGAVIGIQFAGDTTLKVQEQKTIDSWVYGADGLMLCPPTPTWSSSNPAVATIAPAPNQQPQMTTVTGVTTGTVYIRATYRTKTDSIRVTVTP